MSSAVSNLARRGLEVGERQQPIAGRGVVQQLALFGVPQFGDHATGMRAAAAIGSGRVGAPPRSGDNHDLDRTGLSGSKSQPQDADLGEVIPRDPPAPPRDRNDLSCFGFFGVVRARQDVACGVGEKPLLVGQIEVPRRPYSPRIVDEMMLRCTSFDPPQIERLAEVEQMLQPNVRPPESARARRLPP